MMAARRNVMRVPRNIARSDVLRAMERIRAHGVPARREARLWEVRYGGRGYPPKYVISLANISANDRELLHTAFTAGQARDFLETLRFEIREL